MKELLKDKIERFLDNTLNRDKIHVRQEQRSGKLGPYTAHILELYHGSDCIGWSVDDDASRVNLKVAAYTATGFSKMNRAAV